MNTTVELPAPLLDDARRIADRQGTTLGALVEEGLRLVVARHTSTIGFLLSDESVHGEGLHPDAAAAGWDRLREIADRNLATRASSEPPTATSRVFRNS